MLPPIRKERLSNGLTVVLRPVHTAPIISTWIWYRVGSRNEVEGYTGISHWVEHMLFKGSSRFPKGSIMRAVDRHGGYVNAMTSYDFTTYYMTLPAAHAGLALEVEADRMVSTRFDPDEVEAERSVIISEREGSENEPRYVLAEETTAAAFRVHPYHHQTIGWKTDLNAIGREQLYSHYRRYYTPNNAVLVVVGDFDAEEYLAHIREQLEGIPPGEPPDVRIPDEPSQLGERRVVVRLPGSAPLIRLVYHTPPVSHPDYIPMVVLNGILSGGMAMFAFGNGQARSARLYRALVETQLASSVGSHYHPSQDPYLFSLGATVRDGRTPEEVERALSAEIEKLQQDPVEQRELQVAIRQTQAQFAYSSESVSSQALALGFLEMVDTSTRMEGLLDELAQVTPEDVLRVGRTYLVEDNRTVGWFLPNGEGGTSASDAAENAHWTAPGLGFCAYRPESRPPAISAETVLRRELGNGIVVLIKENNASPSVTIEGYLQAGSVAEEDTQIGLASLTALMLRRGIQGQNYQQINAALDDVGASVSFSAGVDDAGFSARSLAADFPLVLGMVAQMLSAPTFPEGELAKLRGQILTQLGIMEMDTGYRADRAFVGALYPPGHPYSRSPLGNRETISALTVDDLQRFYHERYRPDTLVLSIVGAVPAEEALARVEATLGAWQAQGPTRPVQASEVHTPAEIRVRREELPRKAQVDLIWGVVGVRRSHPDYYAALVADLVLGKLGLMGRLGETVRDQHGLAYYVSSTLHSGHGPHPWTITAGVNPRNIDRAVQGIIEQVTRLRAEPISDAELEDSRSYLTGALPLHLETNADIGSFLLNVEEYDLGLDYLQRYPDLIAAVTKEAIQRVVCDHLTLDRYVLAMAGTF